MKCKALICLFIASVNFAFFTNCDTVLRHDPTIYNFTDSNVQLTEKKRSTPVRNVFREALERLEDDDDQLNTENVHRKEVIAEEPETLVKFYYYTKNNPTGLGIRDFNIKNPTVFITHGYGDSYNSSICILIRDAYLKSHDFNVIIADWGPTAKLKYDVSVKHVQAVGDAVGKMIKDMAKCCGLKRYRTTLVGHSEGAHVMGIAGHRAGGSIKQIFGLDPARRGFESLSCGSRICRRDAAHVQIIHTSELGILEPIGDSDFYPNGGKNQPGCVSGNSDFCAHSRAYILFAESLNPIKPFLARQCRAEDDYTRDNCTGRNIARMGGYTFDTQATFGNFYLQTRDKSPYAIGHAFWAVEKLYGPSPNIAVDK